MPLNPEPSKTKKGVINEYNIVVATHQSFLLLAASLLGCNSHRPSAILFKAKKTGSDVGSELRIIPDAFLACILYPSLTLSEPHAILYDFYNKCWEP